MVVPHEVPSAPAVFVNRSADLAWVAGFLNGTRPASRVGVCHGLPGVGKTALIRRGLEFARADRIFADGDLHVDFGAVDGEQPSVSDALAACLGALGVADSAMPATLAGRSNRLRSLTAEKSVVIVLENVTDAA